MHMVKRHTPSDLVGGVTRSRGQVRTVHVQRYTSCCAPIHVQRYTLAGHAGHGGAAGHCAAHGRAASTIHDKPPGQRPQVVHREAQVRVDLLAQQRRHHVLWRHVAAPPAQTGRQATHILVHESATERQGASQLQSVAEPQQLNSLTFHAHGWTCGTCAGGQGQASGVVWLAYA